MDSLLSSSSLIALSLSLLLALSIEKAIKLYKLFSFFQERGLKTPRIWFIAGNLPEMMFTTHYERDRQWVRKLGKIYGVFFGLQPQLVISDPATMNQVAIKDFDAFTNVLDDEFMNPIQKKFLFVLKDDDWRRVRGLMSPTFTTGKMRRMYQLLDQCVEDLELNLGEHLAESSCFDAKSLFSLYTLDAINTCCFSLKIKRFGLSSLDVAASRDELVRIGLDAFKPFPVKYMSRIAARIYPIIKARRADPSRRQADYLQSLIDAADSIRDQANTENKQAYLTDEELISQAVVFILAGLETSGNILTHCHYALAFHPEVQEKLYKELIAIRSLNSETGKYHFELEQLNSCKYLDAVVSETLRRLPAASWLTRITGRDYHFEKHNFSIPEGTIVKLAVSSVMNDPDYWNDPDKFDPERFMPQNMDKIVPGSFCPFGLGPRTCIGMRFALLEIKLAIAKMVTKFQFYPVDGLQFPGKFESHFFFSKMLKPLINARIRD